MQNRAIFLDRDGVINIDKGYVYEQENFIFTDGIFEALKHFQKCGYLLFVATNQSGIARGYYSEDDFLKLTKYMLDEFTKKGINITKVYYCPHSPEANCQCRKPNPKMLLDAKEEFDINMNASWLIGDKQSDIKAALNAKIENTVYFGEGETTAKYKIKSLKEMMKLISLTCKENF
ncbi:MAG: D-glycero-beta-D-manno-heptose 1,7-bisphosphate 7-phosphatase [Campylobacteraceae bacterium]|jgi:D-glycero-D-manno-heptose 1,7-bisphosphate phosphatase|nr:D-glycero-beta-D-manno-heptose 1,7-bisphosphate 7-phosphatase [Campylobacteraceae bacterium]